MTPVARSLAALLLAAWTLPLCAQAGPSAYDRAVAARQADRPRDAVALLEPWLADHPGDVDARVQLGYALLSLGELDRAESEFRRVLATSPDYRDASDGLAAIARRRAEPRPQRGFVLVEGAIDTVAGSAQDWNELGIALSAPLGERDTLDLGANWYRRFGIDNTSLSGLWTHRAADDLWLRLGGLATPEAVYRPKVALTGGLDYRVTGGADPTVLSLDARWEEFPLQQIWTIAPAATRYFGGGRFSVTARASGVVAEGDRLRIGGLVRGDYVPSDRTRFFLGAGAGPDTELGVVTNTRSLFAGGEVAVSGRISLTGSIAREWRDGPGDRTEFRLGVKTGL